MTTFIAKAKEGHLYFGSQTEKFRKTLAEMDGERFSIEPLLPESKSQRGFYHGAVLRLWAYLDGKDYRDNDVIAEMHDIAKIEFNGELRIVGDKQYLIGKSSKGKLRDGFIDRVIDSLEEHYGINRMEVLNPDDYKYWKDVIFPGGGPDTYIGYLILIKKLK